MYGFTKEGKKCESPPSLPKFHGKRSTSFLQLVYSLSRHYPTIYPSSLPFGEITGVYCPGFLTLGSWWIWWWKEGHKGGGGFETNNKILRGILEKAVLNKVNNGISEKANEKNIRRILLKFSTEFI